jgi:alpha-L-fucosidase
LLLNVPADNRGHMPDADFERAREFGEEIRRRFGKSVAETAGTGAQVELRLAKSARVDHVILEEDSRFGQRVRGFRVEGLAGGEWSALYTGSSIGHKRIVAFAAREVAALRLVVTETAGEPDIRRFAAFNVGVAAPENWDAAARVGSDDEAGRWADSKFEVDVTKKIKDATQYRLRFIGDGARVSGIGDVRLLVGGAMEPQLVRSDSRAANVLILTMTEVGQRVVISGTIAGAERGTVLIQKM